MGVGAPGRSVIMRCRTDAPAADAEAGAVGDGGETPHMVAVRGELTGRIEMKKERVCLQGIGPK